MGLLVLFSKKQAKNNKPNLKTNSGNDTILAAQYTEQREYIYHTIQNQILDLNFFLLALIHQPSLAIKANLLNKKFRGYCHGLSETWQSKLEHNYQNEVNIENSDEIFCINSNVLYKQQNQILSFKCKKILTKNYSIPKFIAKVIHDTNDHMAFAITSLSMGTKYTPWKNHWHQIRFYRDHDNYLHFFDANCGWFISKNSNPTRHDIESFLIMIFNVMGYNKTCSVCGVIDLERTNQTKKSSSKLLI